MPGRRTISLRCLAALMLLAMVLSAGRFLRINSARPSDLILVLAGEGHQNGVEKGLGLLQQGYANDLLIDENADVRVYGFIAADLAEEFARGVSGHAAGRVHVCRIEGSFMIAETQYVRRCLSNLPVHTVLLLVPDFQSRRAESTFERALPGYTWYVAPVEDSALFGMQWWKHREWAKHMVTEWLCLVWWLAIDRWKMPHESRQSNNTGSPLTWRSADERH